jgi:uncharacterized protein YjbI with pentapeptide repeats
MANAEHLKLLLQGVDAWNAWREKEPAVKPDLSGADLSAAKLRGANFKEVNLSEAKLRKATLIRANLIRAKLIRAHLCGAKLRGADLKQANLKGAKLNRADLSTAILVQANLTGAHLTGCHVYGISAWGLKLSAGTKQQNLVITPAGEPEVTIDNIEIAQFVYLLLHNERIRDAIDTIGKKGVLLLGRFTGGRITVLERLREELRNRGFLPIVFNFAKPKTRNFTETVRLLAGMSHFVIADITKPKSTPLELQAVIPECMIPFVTIIEEGQKPFAMFKDLWIAHKKWVFAPIRYSSVEELVLGLDKGIIDPAQARFKKLLKEKAEKMPFRRMSKILSLPTPSSV